MKNLLGDISQEEKKRILEMHESATRKQYLKEQEYGYGKNEDTMLDCAESLGFIGRDGNCEGRCLETEIILLDKIMVSCDAFNDTDWDEESFVSALENAKISDVKPTQTILMCTLKKIGGFQLQDNNPLLTIARKAFTTMGMTDFGDKELKMRAEKALSRLGIKTKI
jgi:hypothetical protein